MKNNLINILIILTVLSGIVVIGISRCKQPQQKRVEYNEYLPQTDSLSKTIDSLNEVITVLLDKEVQEVVPSYTRKTFEKNNSTFRQELKQRMSQPKFIADDSIIISLRKSYREYAVSRDSMLPESTDKITFPPPVKPIPVPDILDTYFNN